MLPLSLLDAAQGHPMLVELKNGETLNGHLISSDNWMNLTLKEVVQTSPEGDKFFRLPEVYVRGNNIKYLRVPDEIIDLVKEQQKTQPSNRGRGGGPQRGDYGGRGDRGRGGTRGAGGRGRGRGRGGGVPTRTALRSVAIAQPAAARNLLHQCSDRRLKKEPLQHVRRIGTNRSYATHEPRFENPKDERVLKHLPESEIWDELRKASSKGDFIRVQRIVRILVTVRGECPSSRLYTALILANASPQYGSVQEVGNILREMAEEGLSLDSAAYHAVLKVLAIHPDYTLRNKILDQLRAKWFPLTSDGWHDLVMGCLRDRQVEMALGYLEQMHAESMRIHPWLHDLFAYCFCDTGDFDEVLKLMRYRLDNAEFEMSPTLWYYILDTASRNHHHEATLYAWQNRVEPGYLNPPSGMCINVLNTAARSGDFSLATDVFRILGQRTNSLQIHHYEALFESYLTAGDHRTALSVLPLMVAANIPPTDATVRPLYLYLRQSPELPPKALHTLQQLKKADKTIPTVAINAIIEAAISTNDLTLATNVYKILHTLSSTGPDTATFNALFRGCSKAGRKDTAMFLAAEMLAVKVPPDALTYDRLILVCIEGKTEEDFDDAFKYFQEMKEMGWWPRRGTLVAMAKRFCEWGDERVWGLVEEMEERGMEVGAVQRWVGEKWRRGEERRRRREEGRAEVMADLAQIET